MTAILCNSRQNAFAGGTTFLVRDIQKSGHPAQQVRLEIVQRAVGVHDFPQHFDHADALGMIETLHHRSCERIDMSRLLRAGFRRLQQPARRFPVQTEAFAYQHLDPPLFGGVETTVESPGLDQQRGGSKSEIVGRVLVSGGGVAIASQCSSETRQHSHRVTQRQCTFNPWTSGALAQCGSDCLLPGRAPITVAMTRAADPRRHAPATRRNRDPILGVLRRVLPRRGLILEIASGTGEHAVHFARHLPHLDWQPSDPDPEMRASIAAHAAACGVANLRVPLDIDAARSDWPVETADAVLCINMIHIAPWSCCVGLFAGAARVLAPYRVLVLYGPFRRDGRHTAPSNAAFDEALRRRDPRWGVRDLGEVTALAQDSGFALDEIVEMPANNLTVVFRRTAR